jgi:DNA-binding beta-propeller fold protein YncE
MSRLKRWADNLALVVCSLIFLFVLLEIACRLFLPRSPTVRVDDVAGGAAAPTDFKEIRWSRGSGGPALYDFTATGLRMHKNVRVTIESARLSDRDVEVRTNALGYRGEDVPPKTDRDFRILFLGDSITVADYADENETYPARVGQRLKPLSSRHIEVVNGAVSSIDLRSEFMILMETGLSVKPDIVVVGLYLNDADTSFALQAVSYPPYVRWSRFLTAVLNRTDYLTTLMRYHGREEEHKVEKEQFVAAHPAADEDWHTSPGGFNKEIVEAFGDWGYAWTEDAWRKMGETLVLMKQVARDHDFDLFVTLLPVRQQVQSKLLRDEPQRLFEEVARKNGIAHLDVLPAMREKFASDGVDIFYDHCHYRPEGNELVGGLIADALQKESPRLRAVLDGRRAPEDATPASTQASIPTALVRPMGLAVLPTGDLLVAASGQNAIERVSAEGKLLGPLGRVELKDPASVAFDPRGFAVVADTWNHRILRIGLDGTVLGVLTPPDGGLYAPRDLMVAPDGALVVANSGGAQVLLYDRYGVAVASWGTTGTGEGQFREPLGVALGDGDIYVADYLNARIQQFHFGGAFVRQWRVEPWTRGTQGARPGIAWFRGRLYAADPAGNAMLVFSASGERLGRITSPELSEPGGLAVSSEGTLYVANAASGTISAARLRADGLVSEVGRFAPR